MYAGRTPPSGGDRLGPPPPRPAPAGSAFPQSENGREPARLELTLYPDVVTDVDDAAGRWQHERGRVSDHGTPVGIYASTSHLLTGAWGSHGATLTLTIFFLGTTPPQTLTLHGTHDAGSNCQAGTVSSASGGPASRVGNRFRRTGETVTID